MEQTREGTDTQVCSEPRDPQVEPREFVGNRPRARPIAAAHALRSPLGRLNTADVEGDVEGGVEGGTGSPGGSIGVRLRLDDWFRAHPL